MEVDERRVEQNTKRGCVCLTSLPLNLLAGPSCRLLRARREIFVGARLPTHLRQPLVAEVLAYFAVGKGFRDVTAEYVSIGYGRFARCDESGLG